MTQVLALLVIGVVATVYVEGLSTTGARCIYSCAGLPSGDYQSCNGCDVYASCWGDGILINNIPCDMASHVWDDDLKSCDGSSPTCMGPVSCTPVSTPTAYSYIDIPGIVSSPLTFMFKVKACNDVHVGFYDTSPNGQMCGIPMYEIVIGRLSDTESVIRKEKQQSPPEYSNSGARLSCSEFRDFWITFNNGHIKVGEGFVVNIAQFMNYNDPSPLSGIVKLGISTWYDANGEWCYSL